MILKRLEVGYFICIYSSDCWMLMHAVVIMWKLECGFLLGYNIIDQHILKLNLVFIRILVNL